MKYGLKQTKEDLLTNTQESFSILDTCFIKKFINEERFYQQL